MRAERFAADILDEIRSNIQRDILAVEKASDEVLQQHFVAPWAADEAAWTEGTVAGVIIASHTNHLGMHITDLKAALSP